jgi:hypothetical protein
MTKIRGAWWFGAERRGEHVMAGLPDRQCAWESEDSRKFDATRYPAAKPVEGFGPEAWGGGGVSTSFAQSL